MKPRKLALALAAAALLAACGGGGDDHPDVAGLWDGSTPSGRAVSAITLPDHTAWAVYTAPGNPAVIGGFIQGQLNGPATDFNFEGFGVTDGTLAASVAPHQSIAATLSAPGGTALSFTGAYDPDFDLRPSLAALAGTYTGWVASPSGSEGNTVSVSGSGAISGVSATGCSYSGWAVPRPDANAYDVSITFDPGVCLLGRTTVSGIAYYDASARSLTAALLPPSRDTGFLMVGTKL